MFAHASTSTWPLNGHLFVQMDADVDMDMEICLPLIGWMDMNMACVLKSSDLFESNKYEIDLVWINHPWLKLMNWPSV